MTWGKQNTEAEAHEQMSYAWEQGINFMDAAEMYPVPTEAGTQGLTEKYIGTWMKTQKREDIVLASKVWCIPVAASQNAAELIVCQRAPQATASTLKTSSRTALFGTFSG